MSKYRNIFIRDDATWSVKETEKAIPIVELFSRRPKGARYITRYFPSFKTWRVYDCRTFQRGPFIRGRQTWRAGGYFTATEEATAVMGALMRLQ